MGVIRCGSHVKPTESKTSNPVCWEYASELGACLRAFSHATTAQRSTLPDITGSLVSGLCSKPLPHRPPLPSPPTSAPDYLLPRLYFSFQCVSLLDQSPLISVYRHTHTHTYADRQHKLLQGWCLPRSLLCSQLHTHSLTHGRCSTNTYRMNVHDLGPAPSQATSGKAL